MNKKLIRSGAGWKAIGLLATLAVTSESAIAGLIVFTDQTAWMDAITAIDATADFGLEDWDSEVVTPFPGLGAGPNTYGGGEFDITLNGIGNFDSGTGIIDSGVHDGTNAFEFFVSHDTSDFVCCGGFTIEGEGTESIDITFATAVLGFGAFFDSLSGNDGISIFVNGVTINLGDFYPFDPMDDGNGFFGIVEDDPMLGISSFSFFPDDLSLTSEFEIAEMDDFQWAHAGDGEPEPPEPPTPVPEPGTLGLLGLGLVGLGFSRRRKKV